jgi:preprotein translocase subunit SecB
VGSDGVNETLELAQAQQLAARLAARADIRDVRLFTTRARLVRLPEMDRHLSYHLDSDAVVEHDNGKSFIVRVKYALRIVEANADEEMDPFEDPHALVAEIEFEHGALFTLHMREEDQPARAEELKAFAVSTGQFALYPYAREYIYDVTGRLALPPLTIGVLRLPIARE